MTKKLILYTFLACGVVLPALAVDTATWDSTTGLMEQNKSYTGAAVYDNLGVYENTENNPVVANVWYNINPGYYLPKGSLQAQLCPAGKYCAGIENVGYDANNDQGITGSIAAGYYASSGAKKSNPTSNSDCAGDTCGACNSGYTTLGGASSFIECYKSDNKSCSDFFPVSETVARSGALYASVSDLTFYPSSGGYTSETTSPVASTRHLMPNIFTYSGKKEGAWSPDDLSKCMIRGVKCKTGYRPSGDPVLISDGSSAIDKWVGGLKADSQISSSTIGFSDGYDWGTFNVIFNGGIVRGIWAIGTLNGHEEFTHTSTNSPYVEGEDAAGCYCQIQSIKNSQGEDGAVVSQWFQAPNTTSGIQYCPELCVQRIADMGDSSKTSLWTDISLYEYICYVIENGVLLDPNGATSGTINNLSIADGAVVANCQTGFSIGSQTGGSGNMACSWGDGSKQTNIAKANSVFLGWSADPTCTSTSCLTADVCTNSTDAGSSNQTTYYAVWGAASCTAGTGATNVSLDTIVNNRVQCKGTSKANYYGGFATGGVGATAVTVNFEKCPDGWSSAAGAKLITECYRDITLNKNGGTVKAGKTVNSSVRCYYNKSCEFGVAELEAEGQTFTGGWWTSADCVGDVHEDMNPKQDTYYACHTPKMITIKWTNVKTAGEGFTAVTGENNAYRTTIPYGSNIVTPAEGLTPNANGQVFLGWRFVKSN